MNAVSTKLNYVRRPDGRRGLDAVVSSGAGCLLSRLHSARTAGAASKPLATDFRPITPP